MGLKYDLSVDVCWRDVLRALEWALVVRCNQAARWVDKVQADLLHNYPDVFQGDLRCALAACKRVFFYLELINSLRFFLKYKPLSVDRFGIQRFYDFCLHYCEQ